MRKILLCISSLLSCLFSSPQPVLPEGFSVIDATSQSTWNQPVGVAFSKSGAQLFVWEKAGKLFVCNRNEAGQYIRQTNPVLDIAEEVGNYSDYGLVGFALDPLFGSNGRIYLSYVVDRHHLLNYGTPNYSPSANEINNATIGRIARYTTTTLDGDLVAVSASRYILLGETKETGVPLLHRSHGMGSLVFAADGTLLASAGDGASFEGNDVGSSPFTYYVQALADGIIRPAENVGALRSQMLTSLNGKLLRLDPETGNGVSSNPFFDASRPRATQSRIWSMGLRNPFRISIKPNHGSTNPSAGDIGEVFIGDVGFGTWEELNIVTEKGMNFGWPLFEGNYNETYEGINTENQEVPIPSNIICGSRQFVRFRELLRQDNAAKDASVFYPCTNNTILVGSELHHIHARPVLDWIHANEGYDPPNANARVATFNPGGAATTASIGTIASGVAGNVFNGNASAGGIWYTGDANTWPSDYKNTFLLADYGEQWIKRVTIENVDKVTRIDDFVNNAGGVVSLAENPVDGSIVYVDIINSVIKKISYGGNIPPVAKIKLNGSFSANPDFNVLFDGRQSFDRDGWIVSYFWDFDHPDSYNPVSGSQTPDHDFSTVAGVPRKFVVKLTVTDNLGATATESVIVSANNTPPVVNINSPVKNSKYRIGVDSIYDCKATVTDAEHNAGQLNYEWQTILVHNQHTHAEPVDPNQETAVVISRIGCNGENYHWLTILKVTDNAGLTSIDSSRIYPDCAGALPIFLHKFSVTQRGTSNLINWKTDLESGIEFFEVERSNDGINFKPIDRQQARNLPGPNYYTYSDIQFLPGFNYYRLKIVEGDNSIKYSVIIKTVSGEERTDLKISPNPTDGNFSLLYQSFEKDIITIQIRDVSGRVIQVKKEEVTKGQNVIYMQNLPNWPSGVYYISVAGRNEVKRAKFVKAR